MSTSRSLAPYIAVLSILLTAAAHGQELITNGTFDTDIDGWTQRSPGGTLGWDSAGGNPGGAMLTTDSSVVPTACFPIPTVPSDFVWSAEVFQSSSGTCFLSMVWFDTADCSGSFFELMDFEVAAVTGSWQTLEITLPQVTLVDASSFRPILGSVTEPCLFDNVSFIQTPRFVSPTSIPTLGQTSLLILGVLVAAVGVLGLRRTA